MKKINLALVGLGQIGNYLMNELNKKKNDIELKTGKKIKWNLKKGRRYNIDDIRGIWDLYRWVYKKE